MKMIQHTEFGIKTQRKIKHIMQQVLDLIFCTTMKNYLTWNFLCLKWTWLQSQILQLELWKIGRRIVIR